MKADKESMAAIMTGRSANDSFLKLNESDFCFHLSNESNFLVFLPLY